MIRPSNLTRTEQDRLRRESGYKSGINFVAWLAAKEYKKEGKNINLKEYSREFLDEYTYYALLDEETYEKFYNKVAKELV